MIRKRRNTYIFGERKRSLCHTRKCFSSDNCEYARHPFNDIGYISVMKEIDGQQEQTAHDGIKWCDAIFSEARCRTLVSFCVLRSRQTTVLQTKSFWARKFRGPSSHHKLKVASHTRQWSISFHNLRGCEAAARPRNRFFHKGFPSLQKSCQNLGSKTGPSGEAFYLLPVPPKNWIGWVSHNIDDVANFSASHGWSLLLSQKIHEFLSDSAKFSSFVTTQGGAF